MFEVQLWVGDTCIAIKELPFVPRVGELVGIYGREGLDRVIAVRTLFGKSTWAVQVVLGPR